MFMTIGRLLCLLALLVSCVSSVTVTLSDGLIEVETNKWQVSVYVRQFDNTTQTWRRVPSFSWDYNVERVVEYWADKRDFDCLINPNCTLPALPYNYSLTDPAVESTAVERTFQTDYPDGAKATSFERRVTLPNGASYIQTFITFDRDSYKDVSGWKLPIGPGSVKIVSRFENWPYTTPDPRPDPRPAQQRRLLIQGSTRTTLLPREDANILNDPAQNSPFWVNKTRPLTDAVAAVPSSPVLIFDFIFRHRQFDLIVGFLQNSTRCNSTTDENSCEWLANASSRLGTYEDEAGIFRDLAEQIGGFGFDRNAVQVVRTGLLIAIQVGLHPHGEWDPNLGLIFDDSFEKTISSSGGAPGSATGTAELNSDQRGVAIGVSLAVVAVVVTAGIIAAIVYRKRLNERARIQLAQVRASSLAAAEPAVKQQPKPAATTGRAHASSWSAAKAPSDVRNTFND